MSRGAAEEPLVPFVEREGSAADEAAPDGRAAGCWRCGKPVPAASARCANCLAAVDRRQAARATVADPAQPLLKLIAIYSGMLAVSVVGHLIFLGVIDVERLDRSTILGWDAALQAIDTALVLIGIGILGPSPRHGTASVHAIGAWVTAPLILAVLLALNLGYHAMLRKWFSTPALDVLSPDPSMLPWELLVTCLQPAVVEELFFRKILLDRLRGYVGLHTAVVLSAVMFGFAHIGTPVSIPYLIGLGIYLGYARVATAGLLLPMLIHGAHNAVVVMLEMAQ